MPINLIFIIVYIYSICVCVCVCVCVNKIENSYFNISSLGESRFFKNIFKNHTKLKILNDSVPKPY